MGTEEGNDDKPQDAVVRGQRTLPPAPPPLQTVFPPVSQPSPPYGSPYGYGSAMPPGIAMNQHGMPYEMTTGRAVYLQPPTMYTPRPMTHGIMTPPGLPFMPGHMHHHSTGSPDFLAPPHTPPRNGFIDPATGMPIFSFPRQSTRIEIRQPSDQDGKQLSKPYERRPSGLRPSAADFEPTRAASPYETSAYFQGADSLSATEVHGLNGVDNNSAIPNGHVSPEQVVDTGMMPYSPYQQQPYYYPYPQYYDMSHAQYEMYPTDPRASQAVYY
ncbi:hypothetical protein SERLA73DRAFT_177834 [Serpula lacrymans var. lacrymans S7.3]|uniref:Uncharacterized protein n=2 Tax=Serpula lacrymans var. lacrymans TaxID=341189 RepID=F8PPN9_SERL3|nr:uncharacterized protein SERLADRAFT_461638 [Serpula lacrymans var. lacrymans S7.9]EGO02097.1 hypothetical protein SERLA73DRAFT_177834 [Serpula lacrymans var. lacrymans S7.3]EGO27721.1 hypothetical protein SERLADRAFT_461638 [Serpula lacrymans var. lacrymans S7.9]